VWTGLPLSGRLQSRDGSRFRARPQQAADANADGERYTGSGGGRQPPRKPSSRIVTPRKLAGCAHGLQPSEGLPGGIRLYLLVQSGFTTLVLVDAGMSPIRGPGLLGSPPSFGCMLKVIQKLAQRFPRPEVLLLLRRYSITRPMEPFCTVRIYTIY